MKKIISLICLATIVGCIDGQSESTSMRETGYFGVKLGVNYSNVYDTKGDNFVANPKFGLATGVFFTIPINKVIGIQVELLYSQKGFKSSGTLFGDNYGLTRTTSFIDLPVLLAIKPSENITLLAGPQYAYHIKQKDEISYGTSSVLQEQEFNNENVRKNILCFVAGFDINHNHSVLGARVGWDIQNNKGDGTSSTPRYKNVWYQFTIGYRFY
ncbi:MAG: porin family protein [Bacteroidia bacterium]